MTEEKAQYATRPKNLNDLKRLVEEGGSDWSKALAKLKEATEGKDIRVAMEEGWTVEDFRKILLVPNSTPSETRIPARQEECHFTEAPVSFNVKAISPQGFDIMLTLRDGDTAQLMKRIKGVLKWLADNGFSPTPSRSEPRRGGNNGEQDTSPGGKYCTHKSDDAGFCPLHGKEMKKSKHHPGYYCPAKI